MIKKVKLTKALLARCLNEGCQVYAAMKKTDPEAAKAIEQNPETREFLSSEGRWFPDLHADGIYPQAMAYRLSPDTKPDEDRVDMNVYSSPGGDNMYRYCSPADNSAWFLADAMNDTRFVGYVYPDGSVSGFLTRERGVPTHVRFRV